MPNEADPRSLAARNAQIAKKWVARSSNLLYLR
jgi:hypothetical protein